MKARALEPPHPDAILVDYGCGNAAYLREAASRGWQPIGADAVDTVIDRIRSEGFTAYHTDEIWEVLADRGIAAVRLNHVLEHLEDPVGTLRSIRRALPPGGVLWLAVPNPRSWASVLTRRHWRALEPRHLTLFSTRSVRLALGLSGFGRVRIVHEPKAADFIGSVPHAVGAHRPVRLAVSALAEAAALAGIGDSLIAIAE